MVFSKRSGNIHTYNYIQEQIDINTAGIPVHVIHSAIVPLLFFNDGFNLLCLLWFRVLQRTHGSLSNIMDQLSRKPAKATSQNAPQQNIGTSKGFVLFGVKIISPVTTAQG